MLRLLSDRCIRIVEASAPAPKLSGADEGEPPLALTQAIAAGSCVAALLLAFAVVGLGLRSGADSRAALIAACGGNSSWRPSTPKASHSAPSWRRCGHCRGGVERRVVLDTCASTSSRPLGRLRARPASARMVVGLPGSVNRACRATCPVGGRPVTPVKRRFGPAHGFCPLPLPFPRPVRGHEPPKASTAG